MCVLLRARMHHVADTLGFVAVVGITHTPCTLTVTDLIPQLLAQLVSHLRWGPSESHLLQEAISVWLLVDTEIFAPPFTRGA